PAPDPGCRAPTARPPGPEPAPSRIRGRSSRPEPPPACLANRDPSHRLQPKVLLATISPPSGVAPQLPPRPLAGGGRGPRQRLPVRRRGQQPVEVALRQPHQRGRGRRLPSEDHGGPLRPPARPPRRLGQVEELVP